MAYPFSTEGYLIRTLQNNICTRQVVEGVKDKCLGKMKWRVKDKCFGHHIHSSAYCWAYCYDCGFSWCHCSMSDYHCCCKKTYKKEYDDVINQIKLNKTRRNKKAHQRKKLRKYYNYVP